jgi:CheY-like chemotaxis protein
LRQKFKKNNSKATAWCQRVSQKLPKFTSVLIIDDNRFYASALEAFFTAQGSVCQWRTSAKDGINLLKKIDFSCIVTDMSMEHETSGMQVLRFCQKQQLPGVKIVATTALNNCWTLPFLAQYYAWHGANYLLPKAPIRAVRQFLFLKA